jgi:hypothetical protein
MSWDEERAGRALRGGLARVEVPASRVEIDRILRDGRRGERRTRVATGLAGVALAVVVAVPWAVLAADGHGKISAVDPGRPSATPSRSPVPAICSIADLNQPNPGAALGVADPTGRFLFGQSATHLVRWRDGVVENVVSHKYGVLVPAGVNRSGVAVGTYTATSAQAPQAGWVFRADALTPLPLPAGTRSATPQAINDAGDIVGAAMPADLSRRSVLVVWPAAAPASPRLVDPTTAAVPTAITDDGGVVGNVLGSGGAGDTVAVWAPDGTRRDLVTPAGWRDAKAVDARDGVVYGTVSRMEPAAARSPVRWNLATGESVVAPIEGTLAAANNGWLLVATGTGRVADQLVVVGPDGAAKQLPIPGAVEDGTTTQGIWISGDGTTVIGEPVVGPGVTRAMKWVCS